MAASALAALDRLVAFDTVSERSNLALIDWAEAELVAAGARVRRTPDASGRKANLLASFGPSGAGGIVLSGHTDVVPVAGQEWSTDPFRLTRRGDSVAGRGTADMKGFLAACIAGVTAADHATLRRPVHLALSYDEEVGCLGVPDLVETLVTHEPAPALAVVGEPTGMRIVSTHKSCSVFETVFHGHEAHSSQSHLGVSATVAMGRFVAHLDETFATMREATRQTAPPAAVATLEPPYPTFNVGLASGGTALNIIPGEARLVWEFRALPGQDPHGIAGSLEAHIDEVLVPAMSSARSALRATTRCLAMVPALDPAKNRAARDLLRAIGPYEGDDAVAFGTEAGFFERAGIPTVVCGPGTIAVAHRSDESLPLEQLAAAEKLVERVLAWAGH